MVVFMLGLIILNVTNAETAKKKNPAKTAKDNPFIWKTKRKDFEPAKKKVWGGGLPKTPVIWYFQIKEAEFQMKFHHNKPLT